VNVKLYRVNYEEYLHYEEFIEASSPEEAERMFKNTIHTLEPVEGETFAFEVSDVREGGETDVVEHSNTKTSVKYTD
jgi:hypothetical protein